MNLEEFTEQSLQGVQSAQRLAREYNHQSIEPEHGMRAFSDVSEGVTVQLP